jgi:hypothetical protein
VPDLKVYLIDMNVRNVRLDSLVGIAMDYELGGRGFNSW